MTHMLRFSLIMELNIYNLKVETCYTNEIVASDVLPYTTPTEDDSKCKSCYA